MTRNARRQHGARTVLLCLILLGTATLAGCQATQETKDAAADPKRGVAENPTATATVTSETHDDRLAWSTAQPLGDMALRIAFTRPPDAVGSCTIWVNATMRMDSYKPQVWSALLVGGFGATSGGTNENAVHARVWDDLDTRDADNRDGMWIAWTSKRVAVDLPRFDVIMAAHGVMPLEDGAALAGGQGDPDKALELSASCDGPVHADVDVASSMVLFTENSLSGGLGAGAAGAAVSVGDGFTATYGNLSVYLQRPVHQTEADRARAVGEVRISGPHGQWVWDPTFAEPFVTRYDGGPGRYNLASDLVVVGNIWGLLGEFVPVDSVEALESVFSASEGAGA